MYGNKPIFKEFLAIFLIEKEYSTNKITTNKKTSLHTHSVSQTTCRFK
jgi:hypothetical protein